MPDTDRSLSIAVAIAVAICVTILIAPTPVEPPGQLKPFKVFHRHSCCAENGYHDGDYVGTIYARSDLEAFWKAQETYPPKGGAHIDVKIEDGD